jgi:glycosyltransferase involved in cell wall biosynthesis
LRRLAARHDLHLFTYGPVSDEARRELAENRVQLTVVDPLPPSRGPWFWGRLFGNLFSQYPYSVAKHFTARLQNEVLEACHARTIDIVHIEWMPYARYGTPGVARVLTAHNVESDIWQRRAQHSGTYIGRQFFSIQAKRMESFERRASLHSDCVIAVSELDAQRFGCYGAHNIRIVPNGVDLEYFHSMPDVPRNDSLLFVGSLDWFPNEDAVTDFALRVFPLIRSKNERITFRVVGRRPSEKLARLLEGLPGVELIGEVQDVRPYIAQSRAVVVPLRIGGGTRIKILEALAMEKPVISTAIGAEGLQVKDGCDLLIANAPEEFAARVEALLASPEQQSRLGRNGRVAVEKLYAWDAAAATLEDAWRAVAGQTEAAVSSAVLVAEDARR